MVTTTRENGVFFLGPGNHPDDPATLTQKGSFILVVEDDTPTFRLERVILEEEGYSVEVVGSGEEAVSLVAEKRPDLILLDVGLPGMDGFATCQRIRELSRVPIIMVSGRVGLGDKVRGIDAGADDYLTKPFLIHELAARVKVLLRRSDPDNYEDAPLEPASADSSLSSELAATAELTSELSSTAEATSELAPDAELTSFTPPTPPASTSSTSEAVSESNEDHEEQPLAPLPQPIDDQGTPDQEIYEGTVRLIVITPGPVLNLINFVGELRQNPQFRVLRLVANQKKEGMDVWLGLREPLPLKTTLKGMKGVTEVTAPSHDSLKENECLLRVLLY